MTLSFSTTQKSVLSGCGSELWSDSAGWTLPSLLMGVGPRVVKETCL